MGPQVEREEGRVKDKCYGRMSPCKMEGSLEEGGVDPEVGERVLCSVCVGEWMSVTVSPSRSHKNKKDVVENTTCGFIIISCPARGFVNLPSFPVSKVSLSPSTLRGDE